jgi:hypothetical protein
VHQGVLQSLIPEIRNYQVGDELERVLIDQFKGLLKCRFRVYAG